MLGLQQYYQTKKLLLLTHHNNDLSTDGKVTTGGVSVEYPSTAGDSSNRFKIVYTDKAIDTSSNNGITTDLGRAMKISDSNNRALTYILNQLMTDGSVRTYLSACNMTTAGSYFQNQIGLIARKNGVQDYVVTNPSGFAAAINIKFNSTLSGDIVTVFKALELNSLNFWFNSNSPTNRPSGCDWGAYLMFKGNDSTQNRGFILYIDNNHMACTYNILNATTVAWHIM